MLGSYRTCFPVFFSTFQKFSCFPVFFLFFTVCPIFFQVKILNFQAFSYTGLLQILENLENLEKSTNFIKVREKSGIFFILKAVCIYFLSFLRMIFFSCLFSVYIPYWKKLIWALFYLYYLLWITVSCG